MKVSTTTINLPEPPRLILASTSPRRRELLSRLGIPFSTIAPHCDETLLPAENPECTVKRLAQQKASAVFSEHTDAVVLGCDTIVAVDDMILGKPKDRNDSLRILRLLNGRSHFVFTGVCLMYAQQVLCDVVATQVTFANFSDDILRNYANSGEGDDKAGSYAIQGMGAFLVQSITGSPTNVIGLPLCHVANILNKIGFKLFSQASL